MNLMKEQVLFTYIHILREQKKTTLLNINILLILNGINHDEH